MSSYVIFFDGKEQKDRPRSIKAAADSLIGYMDLILEAQSRTYRECGERFWLATMNAKGHLIRCTYIDVVEILKDYGEVTVFCQSSRYGSFHTGTVKEATQHHADVLLGKANVLLAEEDNPMHQTGPKANETIAKTKEAEADFRRLPSIDDPSMQWVEGDVNPVQILWAAEERIFAYNLYRAVEASPLDPDEIEDRAKLPKGTLYQMVNTIKPMRPTGTMIDSLARVLKVRPSELWYPAVKIYMDVTGSWTKLLKEVDDGNGGL